MKRIVQRLVKWYLKPVESNPKLAIFTKGKLMQHKEEHVHSFIHMIKKNHVETAGKYIVDVGTFEGNTIKLFANQFPDAHVIGFEPNPEMYQISLDNCKGLKNLKIENMALANQESEMDFFVSDNKCASSLRSFNENENFTLGEKLKVKTTSLDGYFNNEESILCLKLDIQGFELEALNTGLRTLERTDYIIIEMNNHDFYQDGAQYHEIDAFLRSKNFKLNNIFAGYNFQSLKEFDAIYERT